MTPISKGAGFVTLINVFTVEPEHQHQLIDPLFNWATQQPTEVCRKFKEELHKPTS